MSQDNQKIFFLLEKIMKRCNLDMATLPTNKEQWQDFIERINNSFNDFEQERYLLERSMEISSREMLELTDRLETAQAIAHIGYWYYNPITGKIFWSKETYHIFGLNPAFPVPDFENVMQLIHEADRKELSILVDHAIHEGKSYENEFRITKPDKSLTWVYAKGQPYKQSPQENHTEDSSLYLLSGIVMDITLRKKTEEELSSLNQKLITLSRQAGMSEIATSILHNIGNILNSANTSISLLIDLVKKSEIKSLGKAIQLLNENLHEKDYLQTHPKGKLIPGYLTELSSELNNEYLSIYDEISNINNCLFHIKEIVDMQNEISGVAGQKESVMINEVCDQALQMVFTRNDKENIQIIKNYQKTEKILVDKSKLMQIIINLLRNAKDALYASNKSDKKNISISITNQEDSIKINIQDNGTGITQDNLSNIFRMGFTTKQHGHGFGLHSSAIAAKELHGDLSVVSDGIDKGASFTLTLSKLKTDR